MHRKVLQPTEREYLKPLCEVDSLTLKLVQFLKQSVECFIDAWLKVNHRLHRVCAGD